ncbi:hypothetical protein [Sphingomonas colocasiae]|uniref:Uncharacterized protein n=1 Tax=Sphingomonas colocasiae TaxID=1848973 RepID=A0ABS7PQ81_9SPHN|nr:hypothetical protein [Sphingomonas colocasiae]MBY8823478.1 hypothetical protein [Sphingomonas colocasiae]
MSDNRNDPIIGRDERDREAEFGNAEDSQRKDTQNTREDTELGGKQGSQSEGEGGATNVEDDGEGAFGDEGEEDDDALIPNTESGNNTGFARNGD